MWSCGTQRLGTNSLGIMRSIMWAFWLKMDLHYGLSVTAKDYLATHPPYIGVLLGGACAAGGGIIVGLLLSVSVPTLTCKYCCLACKCAEVWLAVCMQDPPIHPGLPRRPRTPILRAEAGRAKDTCTFCSLPLTNPKAICERGLGAK